MLPEASGTAASPCGVGGAGPWCRGPGGAPPWRPGTSGTACPNPFWNKMNPLLLHYQPSSYLGVNQGSNAYIVYRMSILDPLKIKYVFFLPISFRSLGYLW